MRIALAKPRRGAGGGTTMAVALTHGLRERGHEMLVLSHPRARVRAQAAAAGFDTAPVLMGRDIPFLPVWRSRRALRRFRADVLFTLMAAPGDLVFTVPAARSLGLPVVARCGVTHGLEPKGREAELYASVDRYIAVSDAIAARLREVLPPGVADPVVIHNGTDIEAFTSAAPADLGLPAGAVVIGLVGRLHLQKGLLELAAAWPGVAAAHPAAHLVVVGEGPDEAEFRRALGDAPRVHWLGFRRDMPALHRAFDLLVLPSHGEGFPNAVVEAMAAARPVVATRVNGPIEAVEHESTGLLVPARDAEALAAALIELVGDPERRARMGAAGAEVARERFDRRRVLDAYERVLLEVAGGA